MIHPTQEQFCELARPGAVIPVYHELPADLETPLSVYLKLHRPEEPAFLLESVERGESIGRYSFIGTAKDRFFEVRQGQVYGQGRDASPQPLGERDAFAWLQQRMARYQAVNLPGLPRFWGGAVGFFGYDTVRQVERLPTPPPDDLELPDAVFIHSRHSVLFDHVLQRMFVVVAAPAGDDPERDYREARAELDDLVAALKRPLDHRPPQPPARPSPACESFNRTREDFIAAVEQGKQHIAAGDIFQIVLSQRFCRRTWADPVTIYRALRILNPSPYMFLLDLVDFQLIGSSPEMLVKLEAETAETRPIAGTRPRGADAHQDDALEAELLADPKERAEHVMLVDLGRNDLGRVCRYGSVEVPQFMEVERFSHVMHLVSSVRGRLHQQRSGFDLMRACFPAGTVSGAPKIRAMELIDGLEPTRRGPYAGAVGYFSYWGSLDTCIALRTMVMKDDTVYIQAGAGIVADSDPAAEYQETLAKLAALRQAVELAEGDLLR